MIFIIFCSDLKKKKKEKNYRKFFISFCKYIWFFAKVQEICTIFFLLDMHHIFLKKSSCQPHFRDDGENQQRKVAKASPTTEMTSLSIFQDLFFFSERKKIDGNIFFWPPLTTTSGQKSPKNVIFCIPIPEVQKISHFFLPLPLCQKNIFPCFFFIFFFFF